MVPHNLVVAIGLMALLGTTHLVVAEETHGTRPIPPAGAAIVQAAAASDSAAVEASSLGVCTLVEGFDDISNLPGWALQNNADVPRFDWFQGNPGRLDSSSPFAATNFESTSGSQISNWLMTPEVIFTSGQTLTFWTRAAGLFADRLQVRISTSGASVDVGNDPLSVGDFTNLLIDINPSLSVPSYPENWSEILLDLSAYAGSQGRVAFRYYVPFGADTLFSNFIGIDTVSICAPPTEAPSASPTTILEGCISCPTESGKVTLCKDNQVTITVNENALDAHCINGASCGPCAF